MIFSQKVEKATPMTNTEIFGLSMLAIFKISFEQSKNLYLYLPLKLNLEQISLIFS